jgi:TrmH family RNA methyltransferase
VVDLAREFFIVLVEPKYSGNIGAVARLMMNFDFSNLYLVNPCRLNSECYSRAMHASPIIDNAKIFNSFEEAIKDLDFLVATSSVSTSSEKKHLRRALLVDEFTKKICEIEGKIGLIFGREDYGLYNKEIARCDLLVKIPTSEKYPSLNLSHAASIFLYNLYLVLKSPSLKTGRTIEGIEKEKLFEFFSILLDEIDYPKHKKENTMIMLRRILGRAAPSKWEYHTLMGILSSTIKKVKE